MSRIAVIGERPRIQGFALAGALTCDADTADDARAAWAALPDDVAVVVLTPAAAAALHTELADPLPRALPVVMPP